MNELLQLYLVFFKVGLFTIGGGLAAIPLLQSEVLSRGWVTAAQLTDMIAVSESTPGPIGINMATYVGFNQLGVIGSIIATLGIATPSFLIICFIARYLFRFNNNIIVMRVFSGLRPAIMGLIASTAISIALIAMFNIPQYQVTGSLLDLLNYKALLIFVILMYDCYKWQRHPIFYVVIAGLIGMLIF